MPNYVTYHLHSDYSLLDSCTSYKDYIDYAVSIGQKAIAFTEHGKPLGWVKKKMYCDKVGIKYIHGVECYLTENPKENIRDNYHTILLARNYQGLKEINSLIGKSCNKDHFYYANRVTFDEFLNLSKNVITISACVASPLNKLSPQNPYYERLAKKYDYYEIQHHNCKQQSDYNIYLAALAEKYNKPLIAATDTHSLNGYKAACRKILLKSKGKGYDDEIQFDLTYKTYDELVAAFEKQDAIPKSLYMQAIENTNILADSVEDFTLDTSLKYPILYGSYEKDKQVFEETISRKFEEKLSAGVIPESQKSAFEKAIEEEKRVFDKIEMNGFILSMSELITYCRENNMPTSFARGSVGGSRIAYVTDIIDLNPETWNTVFSRFANEDRKEVGDIDVDVIAKDQGKIFDYITNRFGADKTARVPTFGTLAEKAVIDHIGRALNAMYIEKNGSEDGSKYTIPFIKAIKKEYENNPDKARVKYKELFYYFDGLLGTKVSQGVHPAGIVVSPITLTNNYGVFPKDDVNCLMIDMDEIHEIGLVKYDFLVLKTVSVINDCCDLAGIPYPKSHEINWEDKAVWEDMIKSPQGIFQMEEDYAFNMLKKFKPKSIFEMSLVTAALRPSGESYRNALMERQPVKNPSKLIDKLLEKNLGYLVYQEDVIAFLQKVCGLTGSEADNIRRAIGRKDKDRLAKAMPSILEGYCQKSEKPRATAEREAKEFLTVIENSSSYMFGYNHSIAYCMLGYLCAYLRYYYPLEFSTAYLNNAANDTDIERGTTLALNKGMTVTPPKFGISKDNYSCDRGKNVIGKGLESVKFMNAEVANYLYEISGYKIFKEEPKYFMDLLTVFHAAKCIDKRQISILIRIDYFSEFGNVTELEKLYGIFACFISQKGFKKYIPMENETLMPYKAEIEKYCRNNGVKYFLDNMQEMLRDIENAVKSEGLQGIDIRKKIEYQKEYLGYIDIHTGKQEDRRKLFVEKVVPLKTTTGRVWGYSIRTKSIGSGKSSALTVNIGAYTQDPIKESDIVYAAALNKNGKGYWTLVDYRICN